MNERRDDARRRVYLGGLIEAAAFLPELSCIVHDVSLTGARIRIAAEATLPDRLILSVPVRGESRLARLMWREGTMAGLRFLRDGENAPTARPPIPATPGGTLH